jgi:hypothetical protein
VILEFFIEALLNYFDNCGLENLVKLIVDGFILNNILEIDLADSK